MERFVTTNAEHLKQSESGTRKIGVLIKEHLLNISTEDGMNPATELTPFAKHVLTSSGDQPLTHINILFAKKKIRATPTPRFINAIRKGNLTYDGGLPDNCSITQLPQSLQGTDLEGLDLAKLLCMDDNDTITEADTDKLNKTVMPFSRTLHFLQDKADADAHAVFLDEYSGPNSLIAREANNWAEFIRDNLSELQDIRTHRDPLLPIRIEVAIADEFNRILKAGRLGVIDERHFGDDIRDGILRRTTCIDIPIAIQELLNKQNGNKRQNQTNQPQAKKAKLERIRHDGQPQDLKMEIQPYRDIITPYATANRTKCPKFNDSTEECLRFSFLGYSNSECPRKAAHIKVTKGSNRYNALKAFKNTATKANKPATQDFQQGEDK
jgi:hypothetical protein